MKQVAMLGAAIPQFKDFRSMQIEFYNFRFEAGKVTCHLWSPWRATALEHRLTGGR